MDNRQRNKQVVDALRARALRLAAPGACEPVRREASVLAYVLDHLPIFLIPGDLLAGDFGWSEDHGADVAELCAEAAQASGGPAPTTPETRLRADFHCFGGYSPAHTCIDYARVLHRGLDGMLHDIHAAGTGPFHDAMACSLCALQRLADRYARRLGEAGEPTLAALCTRVPRRPATTFHEAVQSLWLVHVVIGISEYSDASLSLGRFDQYAYPYYQRSLKDGCFPAELETQFAALVDKLNRYGDAACALNLGGIDANGRDCCNELTRAIVRVAGRQRHAAPILAARIHPDFPQDLFDALTDPDLVAAGQPSFYGEWPCRAALRERGVPDHELPRWAANSCMGLVIEGCEVSNMWGGVVNALLPLELALNRGRPFHKELPIPLAAAPPARFRSFAELHHTFLDCLDEIVGVCIRASQAAMDRMRRERPNPYVSAFLAPCLERGKDRLAGGVRYSTVIIEAFGLANAADALATIKTLVFDRSRCTLDGLVDAAKRNFENAPELLAEIQRIPKYGNGNESVDAFVAELADHFQKTVRSYSTTPDRCYAPSFHTLNTHVAAGKKLGASLDGRRAGEPVAKNIGTTQGAARSGLTALIRSAAAIDQTRFFGGQALDISVDANRLKTIAERRALQALIQTYFRLGGLQIQVNGLRADTLQEAIAHPEQYADLMVKIGGYSDYFNRLGLDVRKEMADRFARGL